MNYITIIAIDGKSSNTMSRTFSTKNVEDFKKSVKEFETEIPYRRYSLECTDDMSEYSKEIIDVLDELEVIY